MRDWLAVLWGLAVLLSPWWVTGVVALVAMRLFPAWEVAIGLSAVGLFVLFMVTVMALPRLGALWAARPSRVAETLPDAVTV